MRHGQASVTIDAFQVEDLDAAHRFTEALRWPHRRVDWQNMFELGSGVAVRDADGILIGTGFLWPWGDACATAGLILVREDRQGEGLGGRIVNALLTAAGSRAVRLHATEAGLKLYEKAGFKPIGIVEQVQGISVRGVADERFVAVQPGDRERLIAIDDAYFGAARPNLIDALMATGEGVVLDEGGELTGFGFRRPFGRGNLIGPVVARNIDDARALITALTLDGFNRIDVTDAARPLLTDLNAAGLTPVAPVVVMTRGVWRQPDANSTCYALASQAFG